MSTKQIAACAPKTLLHFVPLLCILFVPVKAGSIKVCAKFAQDNQVAIVGADVKCWDADTWSNDDFMASGTTGSNGCAYLTYQTKKKKKWWHCNG